MDKIEWHGMRLTIHEVVLNNSQEMRHGNIFQIVWVGKGGLAQIGPTNNILFVETHLCLKCQSTF